MNTLLALSAPQSIHAFQQNSLWMRWGYAGVFAAVCEAWLSPSEVTDEQRSTFRKVQSCFSKLLARQDMHPNPSLPSSAPDRGRYFSQTPSNARGRLRPTVE
jgi:hypothetical protein